MASSGWSTPSATSRASATYTEVRRTSMRLLRSLACIPAIGRYRCCPGEHDHRTAWTRRAETDCTLSTERRRTTRGRRPEPAGQPVVIEDLTAEHRIFLAREWRGGGRAPFRRAGGPGGRPRAARR